MRDGLQGDVIDARKIRRGAAAQPGQLSAVILRQMSSGRANLLFDEIEVVEQPLPRRDDATVSLQSGGQQTARFNQDLFIVRKSREQSIGRPLPCQRVCRRKGFPMLLHLLGAEQLGAQGRLVGYIATGEDAPVQTQHPRPQCFPERPTHGLMHAQHDPGHPLGGNEIGNLHRNQFLLPTLSINAKHLSNQIE